MPEAAPSLEAFVRESNRIEGILRVPTAAELDAHHRLIVSPALTTPVLCDFVRDVAGERLRDQPGLNVRVGRHIPPPGGPAIREALGALLARCFDGDPYGIHQAYERLHPFMDGNGRSGRAVWLWMMFEQARDPYVTHRGFLHTWYYQSLAAEGSDSADRCERAAEPWRCSRPDMASYDAMTGEEVTFIYPPGDADRLPIGGGGDLKQQVQAVVAAINGEPK